jgi:uncharacterized protein (TIGR00304 family)
LDLAVFYAIGILLIIVGVIVILLAVILTSARGTGKSKVRAGGVIMIGPIPIIFGTDKKSVKTIVTLALALTVAAIIFFIIYYWLFG